MTKIFPGIKILSIDIGGTHIKSTVLDEHGKLLTDYRKVITPRPAIPVTILEAIKMLVENFPLFDKISAGFPGYVKDGVIQTAPNLDTKAWQQFELAKKLCEIFGKPARVINDADMQGLSIASGKGFEMMITLGTGFGTALLKNGFLLPHVELAHHPVSKKRTYDDYVGAAALEAAGIEKWNRRMQKVIVILKRVFNYDRLYIGGGNAVKINFNLDSNIQIVTNIEGIHGGARLWRQDENILKTSDKKNVN